jgi:hypothetical protein
MNVIENDNTTSTGTGGNTHISTIICTDTGVWIDNQKVKGHFCCPDTIKGGKRMGGRNNATK